MNRKSRGYWEKWENIERELKEAVIMNEGKRPTSDWLRENGYKGLVNASFRYYEGIGNVMDIVLNRDNGRRPKGYWINWKNVENSVRNAVDDKGDEQLTTTWLNDNGYGDLVCASYRQYGGLQLVLKKVLGEYNGDKQKGYWQELGNTERELKEAIKMNGGERPSVQWLKDNGFRGAYRAAHKYHGGLAKVLEGYFSDGSQEDPLSTLLEEYVGGEN